MPDAPESTCLPNVTCVKCGYSLDRLPLRLVSSTGLVRCPECGLEQRPTSPKHNSLFRVGRVALTLLWASWVVALVGGTAFGFDALALYAGMHLAGPLTDVVTADALVAGATIDQMRPMDSASTYPIVSSDWWLAHRKQYAPVWSLGLGRGLVKALPHAIWIGFGLCTLAAAWWVTFLARRVRTRSICMGVSAALGAALMSVYVSVMGRPVIILGFGNRVTNLVQAMSGFVYTWASLLLLWSLLFVLTWLAARTASRWREIPRTRLL